MATNPKALVDFNEQYYRYPQSIRSGRWPLLAGLSGYERRQRQRWIDNVVKRSTSGLNQWITDRFPQEPIRALLRPLLLSHSVFAEKFFDRAVRDIVIVRFGEHDIDMTEFQRLFSRAWGYARDPRRDVSLMFSDVTSHIYEQCLVTLLQDLELRVQMESQFGDLAQARRCALCGRIFRPIDLPDWVYFGSNGSTVCCFRCPIVRAPRKAELLSLIPEFVTSCGFIPSSDAHPINYAFTSRLPAEKLMAVYRDYARMGGIEHVKRKFGSWFEALAASGALPEGVLHTARGLRCLANDGHVCHSLAEQRIDDWLSARGLAHRREPLYPIHPVLNPTGRRRADWAVSHTFIEYFGLIGDPNYEKKRDEKILLAAKCGIDLISLYPFDLEQLDNRLAHLTLGQ